MNRKRALALASATLVAGLVIGNISGAFAIQPSAADGATPGNEGTVRMGPMMRDAGGRMLDTLAALTGRTTDEIREQRAAGASVADIAESAGVDVDAVVDTALDARARALDDAVAAGTITREQADAALARMQERLRERVTSAETGRGTGCGVGAQTRGEGGQNGGPGMRGGRGSTGERALGGERGFGGGCDGTVCPNAQ